MADALLSGLGIARIAACGDAAETSLADQLLAEPLSGDPRAAYEALRAEQDEGACALVLPPDDVRSLAAALLGLPEGEHGLARPPHGSVAQLRVGPRGPLLHSWGVSIPS